MEKQIIQTITNQFQATHTKQPDSIYFAPGRVNLIGEHTDYNGGYVFPAALTIGTYLAVGKRTDQIIRLQSANFEQIIECSVDDLSYQQSHQWGNYPKGVLNEFQKVGYDLPGLELYFYGNLPNGAGLSSSASIEMVTAYFLATLLNAPLSRTDLATLCQRVENGYIGVNSGIMDQFAVGLGKEHHALFLNTHTLEHDLIPLDLANYKIVITNSNKQRGLSDSKYNERRSECEQGLSDIQAAGYAIETLSDLSVHQIQEVASVVRSAEIAQRVAHVVSENDRVTRAVQLLKEGDLEGFGKLMGDSHQSLSIDYEVTGPELDLLFSLQADAPGCIGTRMTGAGFGGCTVSLVDHQSIDSFTEHVKRHYTEKTGLTPEFYISEAGEGVYQL